jgi:hypothetical protein
MGTPHGYPHIRGTGEGSRKVARLQSGMFDDLTVEMACRELAEHRWTRDEVIQALFDEGVPIKLPDGTKFRELTLRWV